MGWVWHDFGGLSEFRMGVEPPPPPPRYATVYYSPHVGYFVNLKCILYNFPPPFFFFFRRREFSQWSRWRNHRWATTLIPSDGDTQLAAKPRTTPQESKLKRTYRNILKNQNGSTVIKKTTTFPTSTYKYGRYKRTVKLITMFSRKLLGKLYEQHCLTFETDVQFLHSVCYSKRGGGGGIF